MKKYLKPVLFAGTIALFAYLITIFTAAEQLPVARQTIKPVPVAVTDSVDETTLYDSLRLEKAGLSRTAFEYALTGMARLQETGKLRNSRLLSVIDFSMPSSKKRLFVIDLVARKILFNTLVSHGRNSGREAATAFSNDMNSFKSSLGFFVTGDTYLGEHGYSLRLLGEEAGINDNALSRGIVMHSADYVSEQVARAQGYIGRSLGCPAIPETVHRKVIQAIRNGSCLFLYGPDKQYASRSTLLHPRS